MYGDQMKRGHLPKRWKYNSKRNFTIFVDSYTNIRGHWAEGFKHTGDATNYCGLRHVHYDVYVDADNMTEGFKQIIEKRPDFKNAITRGWRNCTHDDSESLMEGIAKQGHQTIGFAGNTSSKLEYYDSLFCDETTTAKVFDRYSEDYRVLRSHTGFERHKCLVTS